MIFSTLFCHFFFSLHLSCEFSCYCHVTEVKGERSFLLHFCRDVTEKTDKPSAYLMTVSGHVAKSVDPLASLAKQLGGSKRNALLKWCQNRTATYTVCVGICCNYRSTVVIA